MGASPAIPRLDEFGPCLTVGAALALAGRLLARAGLDAPGLDARILVADALRASAVTLLAYPERMLGEAAPRLRTALGRRLRREPLARILGEAEFWGLPFRLSPDTLVPRPDTETLIDAARRIVPDAETPLRLLDLGTGSGCILVALLHEFRGASGLAVDRSEGALRTARFNAERNGVGERAAFVVSDWDAAVGGSFQLIVSNPPYIRGADVAGLDPEVALHDPVAALDGGPDGLGAVRSVLDAMGRLLVPGGAGLVEIGHDQAEDASVIAAERGLPVDQVVRDLGGNDRVMVLRRA